MNKKDKLITAALMAAVVAGGLAGLLAAVTARADEMKDATAQRASPSQQVVDVNKTFKKLRLLAGCAVFARNSNRKEYAQQARAMLQEYPGSYKMAVTYYYGNAEGYMTGLAFAARHKNKNLTAQRAVRIAADILFKANKCVKVIGFKI